jgi:hypothetical protein
MFKLVEPEIRGNLVWRLTYNDDVAAGQLAVQKVYLQPGESKEVTIQLNQRSLAFYNVQARAWEADPGVYTISVGASSQDIRLNGKLVNPSLSLVSVSDSEPVPDSEQVRSERSLAKPIEQSLNNLLTVLITNHRSLITTNAPCA